ncbi:Putative LOC100875283, partial [Caligus rogercresseyi]
SPESFYDYERHRYPPPPSSEATQRVPPSFEDVPPAWSDLENLTDLLEINANPLLQQQSHHQQTTTWGASGEEAGYVYGLPSYPPSTADPYSNRENNSGNAHSGATHPQEDISYIGFIANF